MGLHELVLGFVAVTLEELTGLGDEVILTPVLLLPDPTHLFQRSLDDRHLPPQGVDLDHIFEAAPEAIAVVLGVLCIHVVEIEVELDVLLVGSEELLLDLLFM